MAHWLDDVDDPTIVDLTDDAEQDTPVSTHTCRRCGQACIIVATRDSLHGGLPDFCAHSSDRKWRFCSAAPRRIVYYPDGR